MKRMSIASDRKIAFRLCLSLFLLSLLGSFVSVFILVEHAAEYYPIVKAIAFPSFMLAFFVGLTLLMYFGFDDLE